MQTETTDEHRFARIGSGGEAFHCRKSGHRSVKQFQELPGTELGQFSSLSIRVHPWLN